MFERLEAPRRNRTVPFVLAAAAHVVLVLAVLHFVHRQALIVIHSDEPCDNCKLVSPHEGPSRPPSKSPESRPPKPKHRRWLLPPVKEAPPEPIKAIEPEPQASAPPEGSGTSDAEPSGHENGDGQGEPGSGRTDRVGGCIGSGCEGSGPRIIDEPSSLQPGMARPRPLCDSPGPAMPEQARIMGVTGTVFLRYVVGLDGSVERIDLVNSGSAPPVLVEAVRNWLEHCRFTPAVANGQPVRVKIDQSFVFRLR